MAEKVPGWLERVLLPQVSEIKEETKALDAKLGGFQAEVEGEFRAVHSEISRLDQKVGAVDERPTAKIGAPTRN